MQKIASVADLKDAIKQLEEEQIVSKQLFKEQLQRTAESLKPINLIRSTLNEAFSSSDFMSNILGAALGQTAGYVSKRAAFGQTRNPIKKLFGSILQTGIAALLTTYGDTIKETAIIIFKSFFKKKAEPDIEPELGESGTSSI
jgi:hypothetical protein